jgi:hypothetical protein
MRRLIWTTLLSTTMLSTAWSPRSSGQETTSRGQAFMVWSHECLTKVEIVADSTLEAPLNDDGTPDMKKALAKNLPITFKPSCGHIEIRK